MDQAKNAQTIKELTMLLLYLTSWEEKNSFGDTPFRNAWKGYDFNIINELADDELLYQGKHPSRSKSVTLSEEGIAYAQSLLKKYQL